MLCCLGSLSRLFALRFIQILVLSATISIASFTIMPAAISVVLPTSQRSKSDLKRILKVKLLHDHLNFLNYKPITLNLIYSCLEIMCFDKNSDVLNFLSQNMHFHIYFCSTFSVYLINFSIYSLRKPI